MMMSMKTQFTVVLSFDIPSIIDAINKLNPSKPSGFSPISNKLMRECNLNFAFIMNILFKRIISEEFIPVAMKTSKVTPVHKSGKKKEDITSYRPVSVSPNFFAVLDRLVTGCITTHVNEHHLISDNQYGFTPDSNTSLQLYDLLHHVVSSLSDPNTIVVDIIFFDYSSAFDKVIVSKLLSKMTESEFNPKLVAIVGQMMKGRQEVVTFKHGNSRHISPTSGCIQ